MVNFWNNKKVFITGGNGFLGSHLTKLLIQEGVKPFVLLYEDNPGSVFDQEGLAQKVEIIKGDIRDLPLLEKIFKDKKIDTVFHLAAQAIVDQAVDDPLETMEINIQGTWNILEAAKASGMVQRLIVASSDKAYGHHEKLPYEEDVHSLAGVYPYEVSKTCADLISQSYAKTFSLPICITRCTNLYGPGDLKFNRIVPCTIQQLFLGQAPVIRDTEQSLRDYLFVEDAAEAYMKLAEAMNKSFIGEAFNFSTNQPVSVKQAIMTISKEMKKNIQPKVITTKGYEIKNQYASYAKAKAKIGWEPKHSFAEGIKKTIPWYIAYLEKHRV